MDGLEKRNSLWEGSYKGQPAVAACGNLRLVGVDEDLGMSRRATAAVTSNDAIMRPPDWLLVDELYSRVREWLRHPQLAN